ncbi:MAG TPA: MBL fold metallo-hydrolase [Nitrososphaeraceae archaeon]|nr:MBL fold metallo-hydrolase [Nitrososphaeraceae archaeon]
MHSQIKSRDGRLLIEHDDTKILLDPSKVESNDFVFISHAHSDHVYRRPKNKTRIKTITSIETEAIAKARGYEITNTIYEQQDLELIDSGHILGSKGLLAFNEILYTGDISIRKRAFLNPPKKIPQVDTLIIESTFGRPEYIFPDHSKIIHDANMIIADAYDKGHPVIIMGYPLGKAQLLTTFFEHWDPLFAYDSIEVMNKVYREMGISLRNTTCLTDAEKSKKLDTNNPWVMLAPLMNGNSKFLRYMKEKYNTITLGFSGWACNNGYKHMMGIDYALPMSDHCDYNELIQLVHKCNPKKIFTVHGFAHEFAMILNNMGYNASPIGNYSNKFQKTRKESTKINRIKSSSINSIRKRSHNSINSRISNNKNNNILILDYFFK